MTQRPVIWRAVQSSHLYRTHLSDCRRYPYRVSLLLESRQFYTRHLDSKSLQFQKYRTDNVIHLKRPLYSSEKSWFGNPSLVQGRVGRRVLRFLSLYFCPFVRSLSYHPHSGMPLVLPFTLPDWRVSFSPNEFLSRESLLSLSYLRYIFGQIPEHVKYVSVKASGIKRPLPS